MDSRPSLSLCMCVRDVQKRINRLICHLEEQTRVGPRNIVFDADSDLLTGKGHFWQGACKLYGLCKSVGGDASLFQITLDTCFFGVGVSLGS